MSSLNPGRFMAGLIVEGIGVVAIVGLLPKLPWSELTDTGRSVADQRPTLVEQPPTGSGAFFGHEPSIIDARSPKKAPDPLVAISPADPAYVERRLDQASQRLLEGAASYLRQHAEELLQPSAAPIQAQPYYVSPARPPAGSFAPPTNAYRY